MTAKIVVFICLIIFSAIMYGEKFYFGLGVPEGNHFFYEDDNVTHSKFGFLMLTAELGYEYSEDRVVIFKTGVVTDFFLPVPAAMHRSTEDDSEFTGSYKKSMGFFIALANKHQYGDFAAGYGFQGSHKLFRT